MSPLETLLPATKKEAEYLMGLWSFEATYTTFVSAVLPIRWKTRKTASCGVFKRFYLFTFREGEKHRCDVCEKYIDQLLLTCAPLDT